VAYALRQRYNGAKELSKGWTYVGEWYVCYPVFQSQTDKKPSYVHGVMDGEIIEEANNGDWDYERFEIL